MMCMSNQTTQILTWKLGRSGNIEFCGNFIKLKEKDPKVAALLLGHEQQEGYECEDSEYRYKVYHSQYGYSVGRRKKPVFVPETQAPLTIKVAAAEPKKVVAIPDMKQLDNIEEAQQQQQPEYNAELSVDEIYTLKQLVAMLKVISK